MQCSNCVGSLLDVCINAFIDVNLRFDHGSIRWRNNGLVSTGPILRKGIGPDTSCWLRVSCSFALACRKALRAPERLGAAGHLLGAVRNALQAYVDFVVCVAGLLISRCGCMFREWKEIHYQYFVKVKSMWVSILHNSLAGMWHSDSWMLEHATFGMTTYSCAK